MTEWWTRLEAAPRFGGPRRYLRDLLGAQVVGMLERTGVLRHCGIAPTYPCAARRGDHCPRTVVKIDDAYHAVCGNGPHGCRDIILAEDEAGLLTTDMVCLCSIIASALGIRANPERIGELQGVHRVGSVVPEPGIRYPIYLVTRSSAQGYAEVLGALVARQAGRPFAVLVPTDRFLTDDLEQRMRSRGAVVMALVDVMDVMDGRMLARADPQRLFSGLGGTAGPAAGVTAFFARALVRGRAQPPRWLDLDDAAYQDLLGAVDQYDVLADEHQRSVRKGAKLETGVQQSRFRSIFAALTSRGYYDPNVHGPDLAEGKQIFQRARQSFDIKSSSSSWKIFKTIRTDEGRAVYAFRPDADVSFAFIFVPGAERVTASPDGTA